MTSAAPKPGPVTLGDLVREGKLLWLYCRSCGHEREVEPGSIALPPETPVPTLGRRHMVCSACCSREISSKPELYPGGIFAARDRRRGLG